ncbi:hypothetical protein [Maribacter sp. 2-571]|uniref:hypothetical protein n=1 Tax=Maribacter sp. 2-571 TaxID=3417569 RepID=UPI003D325453
MIKMCFVDDGPKVAGYFSPNPGKYYPVDHLGNMLCLRQVSRYEVNGKTNLKLDEPLGKTASYRKNGSKCKKLPTILAYDFMDDFQHPSGMQTSVEIER